MDTDVPSAKRRKISENMAFETEGVLVCTPPAFPGAVVLQGSFHTLATPPQ
jgi:hypothetical protein